MKNLSKLPILLIALTVGIVSSCTKESSTNALEADRNPVKNVNKVSSLPSGVNWVLDAAKSDEFNTFDSNKWSAAPLWYDGGVTGPYFAFKTANAEVNGGFARLKAKQEPHNNTSNSHFFREYTAGCLKSKFEIGANTYTEVRAKMIWRQYNVCAAIWLGDQPTLAKNPNVEIDLQETKWPIDHSKRVFSGLLEWPMPYIKDTSGNIHRGTAHYDLLSGSVDGSFHTYGVERRNGRVRLYINGHMYHDWDASVQPSFVTQLRPLILSIEGHAPGAPVIPVNSAAEFTIDYVRVYNAQ
ncbi:hypothetical protein [Desertivirga xinjiangensis]|uniref:hypothetical protein n=1 Tax=Desertivirga xinjiangensis TaxID=539206 RepID=UPI00210D1288|nr:hypothetical protein [Pedobacter xinjiangensis]